ncbi:hypothetical protein KIN20_004694 [Parelaphostrongylus tenuis]|uniref:Uncharacterized protein n=1 Tax=Parelaphostrongylus tenuis TaxID=148309 RepID=A0AAD5MHC3_PARTN|nr:hypothetical protein KIN20_004694 [Parelaphostrongylus tenuis]
MVDVENNLRKKLPWKRRAAMSRVRASQRGYGPNSGHQTAITVVIKISGLMNLRLSNNHGYTGTLRSTAAVKGATATHSTSQKWLNEERKEKKIGGQKIPEPPKQNIERNEGGSPIWCINGSISAGFFAHYV